MIFKGIGIVWNPKKGKPLCSFNASKEYETNDLYEIEILKACPKAEYVSGEMPIEKDEPEQGKKVTKKQLVVDAKEAGVKGADRMSVDELKEALE